jgi:hypothetical protein
MYGMAQFSRPFAMDNAHRGQASHEGIVEILIKPPEGFFDGKTAQK